MRDTPQPPSDLTAENTNGGVSLSWTPNPAPDVSGYIIQRTHTTDPDITVHVGGYPATTLSTYFDRSIEETGEYEYGVWAVNLFGTESEAETVLVTVTELDAPEVFFPLWLR